MKRLLLMALSGLALSLPSTASARPRNLDGAILLGINLGELPWGGSFKPGISLGYHVNELAYVGVTYQIADSIRRDASSFNASGAGLEGLLRSEESVGQRFLVHARLRPHRLSPFLSLGAVFNDFESHVTNAYHLFSLGMGYAF